MKTGKLIIADSKKVNLCTTELGIYEACNGFWKLATLLKTVSPEDAAEMIAVLAELAKTNLTIISFGGINLQKTLQIARQNQLTFYDASYVVASQEAHATLVTDDRRLCKAADKIVRSVTFKQFQDQIEKRASDE